MGIYDFAGKPPIEEREPVKKRGKKRESLTANEVSERKTTLASKVDRAIETLETAMEEADFSTAIKAAQIILDRTGFGPKTTVDVNTTHRDLSSLSREELAERAQRLASRIRSNGSGASPAIPELPDSGPPTPVTIN